MKATIPTLLLAITVSAAGCGSGEDSAAGDAMGDVSKAAEKMVDDAASQAKGAANAASEAYTTAEKSLSEVAAATKSDPIARCLELAAAMNWGEALAPCTEAAKQKPDDLRIRHAVQQAQAAADAG
jgi:hypothetical protein